MMAVLQNAFANSSSSLIQSKITGNLIFVLLPPLAPAELFLAYVLGAMVRGMVVGAGVFVVTVGFAPAILAMPHPLWALAFALAGSAILGILGLIAGIWADKFDQLAAFQNFIVLPLTFLSGVFYSIQTLPPFWQAASHANPFFYMIDGFRYGFFGLSDTSPWLSLGIVDGLPGGADRAHAHAALARLAPAHLTRTGPPRGAVSWRPRKCAPRPLPCTRPRPSIPNRSARPSPPASPATRSGCAATATTSRRSW